MKQWINRLTDPVRYRAQALLTTAIGVTVVFFIVVVANIWHSYREIRLTNRRMGELELLADDVMDLHEQRIQALLSAVSRRNSQDAELYRRALADLDRVLTSYGDIPKSELIAANLLKCRQAHARLKAVEAQALERVQAGDPDSAMTILFSLPRIQAEEDFHQGFHNADQTLSRQYSAQASHFMRHLLLIIVLTSGFVLLLSCGWMIVVILTRKYYLAHLQSQSALHESETKYRLLIDALPHGVIIHQDNIIQFGNPAAATMLGYSTADELIGVPLVSIIAQQDRERLFGFADARKRGDTDVPDHYNATGLRANQEEFPAEVFVGPIQYGGRSAVQNVIMDVTERKRAEEALRESEERFRNLADTAPVLIWMAGAKRHTYYLNRSWLAFTGHGVAQEYGQGWQQGVHPEDLPRVMQTYDSAFASRSPFTIEYRLRNADGTFHWVLDTGVPRFTSDHQFTGFIGSCVDISARLDAEQALRDGEERFRVLYNKTPAMLHSIDKQGRIVSVSDYWLDVMGYERNEVIGKLAADFLTPEFRRLATEKYIPEHMGRDGVKNLPLQFVTKSSQVIDTILSAVAECDHEGHFVRTLTVNVDVTELRRAEEALRTQAKIIDEIHDGIITTDLDAYITRWSKGAERLYGYRAEEAVGKHIGFLYSDPKSLDTDVITPLLRDGSHTVEVQLHRKSGEEFDAQLHLSCSYDSGGKLQGMIGYSRDVTERKRAEAALRESERLYRSLFENMLNGFAYCRMLYDQDRPQDFIYLDVNDAFETLTGLKGVVGRKVSDVIPGIQEADPELLEIYGRVARTGLAEKFETYVEALKMWFSISVYSPQKDHFVAIFDVITERKQAEGALRESEETLRESQKIAGLGSYILDVSAGKWTSTSVLDEIFGIGQEFQRSVEGWLAIVHPDWREVMADYFSEDVIGKRGRFDKAYQIVKQADGEARWVHGLGRLEFDESDRPVRMIGTIQDITERKQAEDALRESNRKLLRAQHIAKMGFLTWNLKTNDMHWSDEIYRLYGMDPLVEQATLDLTIRMVHPDDIAAAQESLDGALQGLSEHDLDHRIVRSDGQVIWVHSQGELFRDPDGTPSYFVGTQIDITARKQAEAELILLNRALRMLSDSNQALVRISDETTLLNEICRIIVETGGYCLAWVAFAEQDDAKTVRAVAHAGLDSAFIEALHLSWAESEHNHGPGALAIRTGQPCVVRNIAENPAVFPYSEEVLRHGYQAALGLPLTGESGTFGALCIFATDVNAFDAEEMQILAELAADLTYGISTLRTRAERERATQALAESEEQFRTLFETMEQGVVCQDRNGRILKTNPAAEQILGLTFADMKGLTSNDPVWGAVRENGTPFPGEMHPGMVSLLTGVPTSNIVMGITNRRDDQIHWIEVDAVPQFHAGETKPYQVYTIFSDITERKRAVEALRQSEERFHALFEKAPLGYQSLDGNGHFIEINQAWQDTLGYSREEVLGKWFGDFLDAEYVQAFRERFPMFKAAGKVHSEFRMRHKSGDLRYIAFEGRVAHTPEGDFQQTHCILQDITERKRAEEALHDLNQALRAVIDSSPLSVLTMTPDGVVTSWNKASERIFGWTAEEAVGQLDPIIPPEKLPEFRRNIDSLLSGKPVVGAELIRMRKDGSPISIRLWTAALRDTTGLITGILGIHEDITERKQAEEALRGSEERFRQIADSAGEWIWETDSQGLYCYSSPVVERILGYTPEELVGKLHFYDLFSPEVREELRAAALGAFARKESFSGLVNANVHKNGNTIVLETNGVPVLDEKGNLLGYRGSDQDITERRRAEQELERLHAILSAVYENTDTLIYAKDRDSRMVVASPSVANVLGKEQTQIVGHIDTDFHSPEIAAITMANDRDVMRRETAQTFEETVQTPLGPRTFLSTKSPWLNTQREIIGIIGVSVDITERKHVEEALRQSEERLRSIVDSAPFGAHLYELQPDDRLLFIGANKAADRILGVDNGQFIGKTIEDAFPPLADTEIPQRYRHVARTGERYQADQVDYDESGIRGAFEVHAFCTGENRMSVFFRDISERKNAEEALRQSEERFRRMFEEGPLGMTISGADGRFLMVNAALCKILGYEESELTGLTLRDVTHPEYITQNEELVRQVFQGEIPVFRVVKRYVRKDGEAIWGEVTVTAIRDANGKFQNFLAMVQDINERKHAEEALHEAILQRQALFEGAHDAIIIANAESGTILDVNQEAERLTGRKRDELIGSHQRELHAPGEAEKYAQLFRERVIRGDNKADEAEIITADGRRVPVEISASLVELPSGQRVLQGIFRDVTDRKKAKEELAARAAELERSNAELERFAYVASHDLQEPLRMMASYAQLLERRYEGRLDQDANEFIGFITDGAERMRQLIHDLLSFSRVDTRAKPFRKVDSQGVFDKVLMDLHVAASEAGASVTSEPLPTVIADDTQFSQLLRNLISNAIKFRAKVPPVVHVSAVEAGGFWQFSVRDNGIGIDPKYADQIFIIFKRLHGQADYPGTGIGLAICKKIVERHGGRIWVESALGQGATVFFTIPKRRPAEGRSGNDER